MKYLIILTLALPLNAATTLTPATVGSISLESENAPPPIPPGERVLSGSVDFTPGAYTTGVTSTFTVGQASNGATISNSRGSLSYGFFEFDITSLPENIHEASLNLTLPANGLAGSAPTSTQTLDIRLSDFDTTNFQSAYPDTLPPDLLMGNIFAATQIIPSDAGSSIQFTFNEDGLNYLRNASGSSISTLKLIASIGTADYPNTSTLPNSLFLTGAVFTNTGSLPTEQQPTLTITQIPEPSSLSLLSIAAPFLLWRKKPSSIAKQSS